MNRLTVERRVAVVAALVEGNSIPSTVRMTGTNKRTILRILAEVGEACAEYQNHHMIGLSCQRLQVDKIWSFCHAKAKNVPAEKRGTFGYGDVWVWTAIDADTKLVPCWMIGLRDTPYATAFMRDLASRLANRVQLTTDGLKYYLTAVHIAFEGDVDYSQLIKVYGIDPQGEKRYSPGVCIDCIQKTVTGDPDPAHVNTSYVERQNLTMRMRTRLMNAFTKKIENHRAAVALHYMHYNFARVHQTIKMTPAIAAGVTDRVWSLADIVRLAA